MILHKRLILFLLLATSLVSFSIPAAVDAQGLFAGLTGKAPLRIAPRAGFSWFSGLGEIEGQMVDFQTGEEEAVLLSLTAATRPSYGLSVGWAVSPSWDLELNGAYVSTQFGLEGLSAGGASAVHLDDGLGGIEAFMAGVDFRWKPTTTTSWIEPYALMGGGMSIFDLNGLGDFSVVQSVTGAGLRSSPRTVLKPHITAGLGAVLKVRDDVGLMIEAKDRFGPNFLNDTDFESNPDFVGKSSAAGAIHDFQLTVGLRFQPGF